ncbi:MAG: hypothetical protein R3F30_07315 [Planctomycetota bacterium]
MLAQIETSWGPFTQSHVGMMLWIIALPLLAFGLQIFVGRRLPRQGDWLPTAAIFTALVLAATLFHRGIVLDPSPQLLLHSARDVPLGQRGWSLDWFFGGPAATTSRSRCCSTTSRP